jgi:hypothetical protein
MASPADRGAVLVSALVATVVGAVLAVGASLIVVSSASDAGAPPVDKPLVSYDQK